MALKKKIERFQIDSLLKRLAKLGHAIPESIEETERPDFILRLAREQIGLETTRAVYQEHIRADKLQQMHYPNECIITMNLMDRTRRRSNDEILGDMLSIESPWKDCEQDMRDWQDKVSRSLTTKREKLNQPDFRVFDRNWLLIYDEPGLANDAFTFDRACRHLATTFCVQSRHPRDYDAVFVLSHRYLFRWQGNVLSLHYDRKGA
jgi:hypothetical protein